ncbi:hypothetical protein NDN08_007189 [Rhodosorus marinus]|uniref:F-box domain-containing protein n=1 Tax=Rhodosorus marinus TaxID=101924 RepID=A0AAV8UJV4_9RHOD|nr:hypothetical protein NDN08_007189 [Rhodosorus marinus]
MEELTIDVIHEIANQLTRKDRLEFSLCCRRVFCIVSGERKLVECEERLRTREALSRAFSEKALKQPTVIVVERITVPVRTRRSLRIKTAYKKAVKAIVSDFSYDGELLAFSRGADAYVSPSNPVELFLCKLDDGGVSLIRRLTLDGNIGDLKVSRSGLFVAVRVLKSGDITVFNSVGDVISVQRTGRYTNVHGAQTAFTKEDDLLFLWDKPRSGWARGYPPVLYQSPPPFTKVVEMPSLPHAICENAQVCLQDCGILIFYEMERREAAVFRLMLTNNSVEYQRILRHKGVPANRWIKYYPRYIHEDLPNFRDWISWDCETLRGAKPRLHPRAETWFHCASRAARTCETQCFNLSGPWVFADFCVREETGWCVYALDSPHHEVQVAGVTNLLPFLEDSNPNTWGILSPKLDQSEEENGVDDVRSMG